MLLKSLEKAHRNQQPLQHCQDTDSKRECPTSCFTPVIHQTPFRQAWKPNRKQNQCNVLLVFYSRQNVWNYWKLKNCINRQNFVGLISKEPYRVCPVRGSLWNALRASEKAITPPERESRGEIYKNCVRWTGDTKALSWRCMCIDLLLQFISIA